MSYIYLKARAKINLALDILDKREDGYHNMLMIMQTLTLHDTIFIKKTDKKGIELYTNLYYLPVNEKNLVYKATQVFLEKYKINQGLYIKINKNIPVAAGLGGGSTDCAATLIGLRNMFKIKIGLDELAKIGKELGADVPFCIYRGTAKAEGIGDKLTLLENHPNVFVLLAKPKINISTKTVFQKYNFNSEVKKPNVENIIEGINKKDLFKIANGFGNVLESVTEKQYPIITELKNIMLEFKALNSLMTGSGPTVFGYFINKKDATLAMEYIKKNFESANIELYLTSIFNPQKRNGL